MNAHIIVSSSVAVPMILFPCLHFCNHFIQTRRLLSVGARIHVCLILYSWSNVCFHSRVSDLKDSRYGCVLPLHESVMNHWTPFFSTILMEPLHAGSHQHKTTLSFQFYTIHITHFSFNLLPCINFCLYGLADFVSCASGLILQVDVYSSP